MQPANRAIWKTSANPERAYTALLDEDLAFVRFVNPGDLRAAPAVLRALPRERGQERLQEPDDARRASSTRPRSTTTACCPARTRSSARATGPDGKPRILKTVPPPDRGRDAEEGRAGRRWSRSCAGSWACPATRSASSSAAGGGAWRSGCPTCSRSRASRTRASRQRGFGTLNRTDPVDPGRAEDAPARSAALDAGHERPSRRLPLQRLHGLPRRLRERPLARSTAGPTRRSATAASRRPRTRRSRSDEPGHPAQARLHARRSRPASA